MQSYWGIPSNSGPTRRGSQHFSSHRASHLETPQAFNKTEQAPRKLLNCVWWASSSKLPQGILSCPSQALMAHVKKEDPKGKGKGSKSATRLEFSNVVPKLSESAKACIHSLPPWNGFPSLHFCCLFFSRDRFWSWRVVQVPFHSKRWKCFWAPAP